MNVNLKIKKKFIFFLVVAGVAVKYYYFGSVKPKFDMKNFDVEVVKRGNILKTITANGTINPVSVVSVGTQVSGTVEQLYVDYNDPVKVGDKLAKIDTSILEKTVNEAKETMDKSSANLSLVRSNYNKVLNLYKENFVAKVDLEQAETELKNAKADYNIANSKYEIAKINLGYASINSPVDGVVISREIDVGQTVAASFSAPVLFKIAEDLTKMQIETSVSEADIGSVKVGLEVDFGVDSFPSEVFKGNIRQIRLNPVSESNVVVYNVIIDIKNDDKKLMPGMTAYVSIPVAEVSDVLKVSSVALRFNPDPALIETIGAQRLDQKPGSVIVYKLEGEKATSIYVKRGLSNLGESEIISDSLREGDKIISNSTLIKKKN